MLMRISSTLLFVLVATWLARPAAAEQPNVLFIFADDQCFDTLRSLGNEEIETPNLDRLVSRGMTFTHCYNQGSWSGAVCVASRTMLVTGRYLWHANDVYKESEKERAAGRFWPEYMRAAGYETYFTGKWHIRADANKAFDTAMNVRGGMPNQTPQGYNRPIEGQEDPWSPYDPKFEGFWKGGRHWSEVVADDATSYLNRASQREKPFFMYIAFNAPHDPRQSPKEYVDKYPWRKIKVPRNFQPLYPYKDSIGLGTKQRDEKLAPFPRTRYSVQVNRQEYYAIITHMDTQIGRILEALEASGKADNTYIFFTADHGLAVGHHGLIGKQNMYDHSVRVPFMAVGPGIPVGKKTENPIYLQDVMPTTLELAGVDKPDHVEFHSLKPFFEGEEYRPYDAIYGGYLKLQRAVTWNDYKLIMYPTVPVYRLFNLKDDPDEMVDLAKQVGHQATVTKLFGRLLELQQETGDKLDLKEAFPDLAAR